MAARNSLRACLLLVLAASASAQTWPVGLTSTLQFTTPVVGPASLGGLTFNASGSQLLLAGGAAGSGAVAYAYTPVRDPGTSRITGLSAPSAFASTPSVDGGLDLHAGILFWATYPTHQVGQFNTVTATSTMTPLPTAWSTTGGLTVVPAGYPNAGTLLVSSYSTGDIYAIPLIPAGNGFFNLGVAVLWANMPASGSEGMDFVASGPLAGSLLVANYAFGQIDVVSVDAFTGLPVGGPSAPVVSPLITNLSGAEGVAIDPVSGDLFVSSYSSSTLFRVDGLGTLTALAADYSSASVGFGASINLYVRAGTSHANRAYGLAASASGTSPGTPIGLVTVPLNVDAITDLVLTNINTPLFMNFLGTTNASGAATATLNIPPFMLGGPVSLHFAGALLNPVDFATNAVNVVFFP
jgi:hypothetical protein